jgi:hypothetical protein
MPPADSNARLDRAIDQALRRLARIGAVAVALVGFIARTQHGRQAARRVEASLDDVSRRIDRQTPQIDALAARAMTFVDRLIKKCRS